MGVWRSDFEAIDGFDETFDGWGHEDADFVLRLQRHGCARVDGYWATEVLHLWHRQAARAQEGHNLHRVQERMQGDVVRAEHGLSHPRLPHLERGAWVLRDEPPRAMPAAAPKA
jgi:predicted glycosyltransferase involved in capsule biosynthesis